MTISGGTPAPTILTLCNSDHGRLLLFLLSLLPHTSTPAYAQLPNTPPPLPSPIDPISRVGFDKSMGILFVILVVVFFALGFLSVYSRQCAERRFRSTHNLTIPIGSSNRRPRGLDPEIIHTFPTFVYSAVKGLKIGRSALECAVCLNEFQDHETLRFIPKCSHVFHPHCIDLWLSSHSTCPVCRAILAPTPGDDASFVAIRIPDSRPESEDQPNRDIVQLEPENAIASRVGDFSPNNRRDTINLLERNQWTNQKGAARSRSTGFGMAGLFPRSHSTGHSLVSGGENRERFTLRLPEEVRKELVKSTLNRTKSCATFRRMSSERSGYRTRSVGSGGGGGNEGWGLTWTPPFISRSRKGWKPAVESSEVAMDERSSD